MSIFIFMLLLTFWTFILVHAYIGKRFRILSETFIYIMSGIGFAQAVILPIMNFYK